ncbi:hypothetical protein SJAV_27540 [Sulfurisphaera javensis]|uniref:Uncharacterized protein n=1 Tax=Sulfurisphaera javensis TaxID=2049879 RepID=A0AAT9GV94_9CREN
MDLAKLSSLINRLSKTSLSVNEVDKSFLQFLISFKLVKIEDDKIVLDKNFFLHDFVILYTENKVTISDKNYTRSHSYILVSTKEGLTNFFFTYDLTPIKVFRFHKSTRGLLTDSIIEIEPKIIERKPNLIKFSFQLDPPTSIGEIIKTGYYVYSEIKRDEKIEFFYIPYPSFNVKIQIIDKDKVKNASVNKVILFLAKEPVLLPLRENYSLDIKGNVIDVNLSNVETGIIGIRWVKSD